MTPVSQSSLERSNVIPTLPAESAAVLVSFMGDDALAWLVKPAMGLNWQRPIDLLATEEGVQVVHDFLMRLEHGVYT